MKKIFLPLLVVVILFGGFGAVNAQTTAETTVISTSALQQLLNLLLQELSLLQQEYAQMLATQNTVAQANPTTDSVTSTTEVATTTVATTTSTLNQIAAAIPQVVQTTPVQQQNIVAMTAPVQKTSLDGNETGWVIGYARLIRTDDPTNCPQIDLSTTTHNIANIDSYMNQSSTPTINGTPVTGINKVTAGEQITIQNNYRTAYCTKMSFDAGGEDVGMAQSPTQFTFTVPTDMPPGVFFTTGLSIGFRVVTSTAQ
jgi:hypothetical protein